LNQLIARQRAFGLVSKKSESNFELFPQTKRKLAMYYPDKAKDRNKKNERLWWSEKNREWKRLCSTFRGRCLVTWAGTSGAEGARLKPCKGMMGLLGQPLI